MPSVRQRRRAVSMPTTARKTLAKADFFLARAEEAGFTDREAFCHFLEAAIVFARSVTLHLQKEFRRCNGFDSWYQGWRSRMRGDALCSFLTEQRNYALKEGPLGVRKNVSVEIAETVFVEESVHVVVKRGRPWYRRPPRILIEDGIWPLRQWWHERKQRRERDRRRREAPRREAKGTVRETYHFADPNWNATPAVDLIRRHLSLLEQVVTDAETRFT